MQGLNRPDRCIFCGGSDFVQAVSYDSAPDGENYFDLEEQTYSRSYDRCRTCGHHYGNHGLDLRALYQAQYVDSVYGGISGMQDQLNKILSLPSDQSDNFTRVERIKKFTTRFPQAEKRLLDVGAGIGVFPAAMKEQGWNVAAIETDERTVEHLRNSVQIKAFGENLLSLGYETLGSFSVITFNKVLEHVEEPIQLLKKATEFLSEGGFIYVELPDVIARREGYDREEFFIEHHHVFSPASYVLMVERADLSLILLDRYRDPSGKYTLSGFMML